MENADIKTSSLEEARALREQGKTETRADAPRYSVDESFWENARVVLPDGRPKVHTGIRLDADMLEWFKSQGKGWQSRMNAVLRSYFESHHKAQ
jgi:uncharacterized protein (DUF4415 family)